MILVVKGCALDVFFQLPKLHGPLQNLSDFLLIFGAVRVPCIKIRDPRLAHARVHTQELLFHLTVEMSQDLQSTKLGTGLDVRDLKHYVRRRLTS